MASPSDAYQRIGAITLRLRKTFRQQFETASWYEDVECEPQTVELLSNGYWLIFTFEGACTSSYFVNRVFQASSAEVDRNVGQARNYTVQTYAYFLHELLGIGGDYRVLLDDDVLVVGQVSQCGEGEYAFTTMHSRIHLPVRA
jgi:hypothetical protein